MAIIFSSYPGSLAIGHPRKDNCSSLRNARKSPSEPQLSILLYPTSRILKFVVSRTHAGIAFNALCDTRSSRKPPDDFNASALNFRILFRERLSFRSAGLSLSASPTSSTEHSPHTNVLSSFNPFTALKSSIAHSDAINAASAFIFSTPLSVRSDALPLTLTVRARGQPSPSARSASASNALFAAEIHVSDVLATPDNERSPLSLISSFFIVDDAEANASEAMKDKAQDFATTASPMVRASTSAASSVLPRELMRECDGGDVCGVHVRTLLADVSRGVTEWRSVVVTNVRKLLNKNLNSVQHIQSPTTQSGSVMSQRFNRYYRNRRRRRRRRNPQRMVVQCRPRRHPRRTRLSQAAAFSTRTAHKL